MTLHRFDVILQSTTGVPADNTVNTWKFSGGDGVTDYDNVRDMLADFYTVPPDTEGSSGNSVAGFFPDELISTTALVRAYNLEEDPPRVPVYESSFTIPSISPNPALPTEVALVLSYQGSPESGTPQARRRNRVYIGPFSTTALGATPGRPSALLTETMTGAARRLKEASDASVSWEWVWHSPTTGGIGIIVGGWVDNSWDTQRRRGLDPSSRELFSSSVPVDDV